MSAHSPNYDCSSEDRQPFSLRGRTMVDSCRSSHVPLHSPRRLTFEPLEERRMLATIMVTSLADDLTVDGDVTLREAIHAAEHNISMDGSTAGSGADII